MHALRLCLLLLQRVLLHPCQELLSAARQADVLDPHVDPLLHVPVADFLVDDHADGAACHVVDHAGFAVVHFVGHSFLYGAIGFDIDDVSDSGGGVSLHASEGERRVTNL
jgi:hypothetical protein